MTNDMIILSQHFQSYNDTDIGGRVWLLYVLVTIMIVLCFADVRMGLVGEIKVMVLDVAAKMV